MAGIMTSKQKIAMAIKSKMKDPTAAQLTPPKPMEPQDPLVKAYKPKFFQLKQKLKKF